MDNHGVIYLVDGPRAFRSSPLGRAISRPYGHHAEKRLVSTKVRGCDRDADCPSTRENHGAPESKGECRDGACVLISEKTHVFDSANRPWLLPFIAEKATGPERDILLTLIRHASAHQPEHRPSFAQMVDHLDRFEHQKRAN